MIFLGNPVSFAFSLSDELIRTLSISMCVVPLCLSLFSLHLFDVTIVEEEEERLEFA